MLESQRAVNGAKVVALKLQQTRLKAMRENRPCGIEFMLFDDNAINASLQMRTVKNAPNFIQLYYQGYELRCLVTPNPPPDPSNPSNNNTAKIELAIRLTTATPTSWEKINTESPNNIERYFIDTWKRKVTKGLSIQFDRQGKWYYLEDSFTVADCSGVQFSDAVEFKVTQRPIPMLNSITVLPRGTIVDLRHSGYENDMRNGHVNSQSAGINFGLSSSSPPPEYAPRSVIVMFSPAGYVDRFYVDGHQNVDANLEEILPFRGVFYLLVGEWDKIVSGEDGKDNLKTQSNFWVTIKDRDGTVRISPNAEIKNSNKITAQQHAYEDLYKNIGGL
jgi:hypothetical protein